jgi:REP element-mobilizing transposase RayT
MTKMASRRGDPCGRRILKRRHNSLRLKDYDYSQCGAYFVTICCKNHQHIFNTRKIRQEILEQMDGLEKRFGIFFDCGVVSSNHIHILLEYLDNLSITLSQIVGAFKSLVYHQMRKGGDKPHPYATFSSSFWQRGFYDHIIRNQKDWDAKAKYIETHPIKEELLGLPPGAAVLKWH